MMSRSLLLVCLVLWLASCSGEDAHKKEEAVTTAPEDTTSQVKKKDCYLDQTITFSFTPGGENDHLFLAYPLESDKPGDTLQIIFSDRSAWAVIDSIAEFSDACDAGERCYLSFLDERPDYVTWEDTYPVLRKVYFYEGEIIPYKEYDITEILPPDQQERYCSLIKDDLWTSWEERYDKRKQATPEFQGHQFHVFGPVDTTSNEAFYISGHGLTGNNLNCWFAFFGLIMNEDGEVVDVKKMRNSYFGPIYFRISASMDLNGDGNRDFLVMTPASGNVFQIVNGEFHRFTHGKYRGC